MKFQVPIFCNQPTIVGCSGALSTWTLWFAIAPHNFQLKKKILLKHRELAKMEAKVKSYLQILYENILEN